MWLPCVVVSARINNPTGFMKKLRMLSERLILVPIMIDKVKPPLGFRRMQAAWLMNWTGESNHPEFEELLNSIEVILGTPQQRSKR